MTIFRNCTHWHEADIYIISSCFPAGIYLRELSQQTNLPLPRFPKLRKPQTRLGFTFAGEKLLHQPFFMGLERIHFAGLCSDQFIQGTQAVGDFLLFGR